MYTRTSNSLFNSPKEAAHPGRMPDVFAWVCRPLRYEERLVPELPSAADD